MDFRINFCVFLLLLVPRPAQLGLLENMTESLCLANRERDLQSRENLKALVDLRQVIRNDFKVLGDVFKEMMGDHGNRFGNELITESKEDVKGFSEENNGTKQEVKELGEQLLKLQEDLKKENQQIRQERITQHDQMMDVFNKILKSLEFEEDENLPPARDCAVLYKSGKKISGVHKIKPDEMKKEFDVFCDMELDGGGWTVFQRRGNYGTPSDYFYKTWNEYKHGFGDLNGEHWLGNDRISTLSKQGYYELHIEMLDYDHNRIYARYGKFMIEGEEQLYKLHVGSYSGNNRDSMGYHDRMYFSTHDRDNDQASHNCAQENAGAWWYKGCHLSNLNSKKDKNQKFLCWYNLTARYVDLSYVLMKIRPLSF